MVTEYVPTDEKTGPRYPAAADHRAHPQPVQRRRADPAHRQRRSGTTEDRLEIHPPDAESAASTTATGCGRQPRRRDRPARAGHRSRRARAWSTPPSTIR